MLLSKGLQGRMALAFGLSCGAALSDFGLLVTSGWLLAAAAQAGLGGYVTQNAFNMFLPAAGVRLFATIRILSRYGERVATHDVVLRVTGRLRTWVFANLIPKMPALSEENRSGDMMARFAADADTLATIWSDVVLPVSTALVCGCVAVGLMASVSKEAAIFLCSGLVISGLILPWIAGRLCEEGTQFITRRQEIMRGDLVEAIQGVGELRVMGAVTGIIARFETLQREIGTARIRLLVRESGARALNSFLMICVTLAIIVIAVEAMQSHEISGSCVPMLMLGTLCAFGFVSPLVATRMAALRARVAADRVFPLCDTEKTEKNTRYYHGLLDHGLEMAHVTMCYPRRTEPVFQDVNLVIRPGERVALVGESGSGKSSLIKVIFSFYDFQEGNITFGGVDLRTLDTEVMAECISVVSQDFHLFVGSVRRNLLIACPYADEDAMWRALDAAQIGAFIRNSPAGLNTLIGEAGVKLSGGQARRLAMAQAILRNTPWIILDEPTEGLDEETECQLIHSFLDVIPKTTTVLCITHRLRNIHFPGRIIMLEQGKFRDKKI
ncbi:thiol reductant ABC exporter subunit CydC [Acetobacter conturbans]|uniref:thiol reductant ABC exporter subunit CydC n=1 Tax=Acetobacter conturbans TaxID=1737472 RepID=UPI0015696A7C|nr:thiol reductant ABC exporter subunit CydC [Acetobacter conturbans]